MRFYRIFSIVLLVTVVMISIPAMTYAECVKVSVYKDLEAGTVSVEAVSLPGKTVMIEVLPENITPAEIENDPNLGQSVEYIRSEVADETGKAVFVFSLEPGSYTLYASYDDADELYAEKLGFADASVYASLIKTLKEKDRSEFVSMVNTDENKKTLGFDIDIYSEKAVGRLYDEYKKELSETDYELNLNNYIKCAMAEALVSGKAIDASEYINKLYPDDEICALLEKYVSTDTAKSFFTQHMTSASAGNIKDSAELYATAKKALLLTVVKYPGEAINIKSAMETYKDITGIASPTSYASVYRSLAGNDYSTIASFTSAYNSAISTSESSSGSSGSGGGGGGGGGASSGSKSSLSVTPKTGSSGMVTPTADVGQTSNIQVFDDLTSVPWANEAVLELYKKGIVNGRENRKFVPDDYVLREEFAKMLIAAFDLKLAGYDMSFEDVPPEAWFYDYVRIAYDAEIITGINDTHFGAGQNITRQDICVMAYRALNVCEIDIPDIAEKIAFADEAEIADYATEAVNKLQMSGIINGDDEGNFNPVATATRAEAAKIIYGVYKLVERS